MHRKEQNALVKGTCEGKNRAVQAWQRVGEEMSEKRNRGGGNMNECVWEKRGEGERCMWERSRVSHMHTLWAESP
jgi:hypothetical protein